MGTEYTVFLIEEFAWGNEDGKDDVIKQVSSIVEGAALLADLDRILIFDFHKTHPDCLINKVPYDAIMYTSTYVLVPTLLEDEKEKRLSLQTTVLYASYKCRRCNKIFHVRVETFEDRTKVTPTHLETYTNIRDGSIELHNCDNEVFGCADFIALQIGFS